jgi:hypothetical protein
MGHTFFSVFRLTDDDGGLVSMRRLVLPRLSGRRLEIVLEGAVKHVHVLRVWLLLLLFVSLLPIWFAIRIPQMFRCSTPLQHNVYQGLTKRGGCWHRKLAANILQQKVGQG